MIIVRKKGQFSPSLFFKLASFGVFISLILLYSIAIYLQHEKPWPSTSTISSFAGHYPEYIIFRISTISGSAIMLLGWFANHFYLKTIAREKVFRIEKYRPEVSLIMGIISALFLMGSTANIDTGVRSGVWHRYCASRFFIFAILAQLYNLVVCWIIHSKIGKINLINLYFKSFLFVLQVVQIIIDLNYNNILFFQDSVGGKVGDIVEWTFTITLLLGMYAMAIDIENFQFMYEQVQQPSSQDNDLQQL